MAYRGTASVSNAATDLDSAQCEYNIWSEFPRAANHLEKEGVLSRSNPLYIHQGFLLLHNILFEEQQRSCEEASNVMWKWMSECKLVLCGHR